jgi:hypothetical protein
VVLTEVLPLSLTLVATLAGVSVLSLAFALA